MVNKPEKFTREFKLDRAAANPEARTVALSFSSETPVERYFGMEVLDHSPGACDLSRLLDGGPLLADHDPCEQIGVIESAQIDPDKVGRAVVRFSKSEDGEEYFQDVLDGIRTKVSVGYMVLQTETTDSPGSPSVVRVTKWQPLEISLVSIPADTKVGVGRAAEITTTQTKEMENNTPAPAASPSPGAQIVRDYAGEHKEMAAMAERFKRHDLLVKASKEAWTLEQFRSELLNGFEKATPVTQSANIGLSEKEVKQFSLMRGIQSIVRSGKLDGFEREVSDEASKHYKRTGTDADKTIILPEEIVQRSHQTRAQNVTTATAGGFTVATTLGPLIEYLRNDTVLGRLGVTELTGLVGDFALPVQTGGATAYWVSETGALTDSEATFGQKIMTPKRLGATIPFSTQFLAQSSLSAEQFVQNELMTVLAIELDRAGLLGSGVGGEPLGLANTSGINATVTYGGAAVWADVVEHETGINVDNANIGDMAFILSSAAVGKWKTILKDSVAGAGYLLSDNMTANGYRVERSNQISSANQSFFGAWRQVIRATWAGREVIVDPYALKKSGQVEITMNQMHDYLVRQPLAFNVSTDSAAQ